jgi:hypothetical protein
MVARSGREKGSYRRLSFMYKMVGERRLSFMVVFMKSIGCPFRKMVVSRLFGVRRMLGFTFQGDLRILGERQLSFIFKILGERRLSFMVVFMESIGYPFRKMVVSPVFGVRRMLGYYW